MTINNEELWNKTEQWIDSVFDYFKDRKPNDLTQVYAKGPFAGWSERQVYELATLWKENLTKFHFWKSAKDAS